ncbi:MAG: TlpA family protein disulfide reductase [Clostridiales bacterium]|nr:TlpA family protein disulfide reductase [Clostridiales bacterium]
MKTKYIILAVVIVVLFVGAIAVYRQLSKKYTPPMDLPPPTTAGKMPDATTPSDGITVEPRPSSQTNPSTEGTTSGKKPDVTEDIKKNTAPDFTVLDKDGNTVRLSDKFGKPIVINFWATWCPPCKQELPDFDKLSKEYGDRVVFMMVNLTDGYRDTVDGTKRFVSGKGYTFPVYFDTKDNAASAYNVSSIPQTTFIDAKGNIYTTRIGAMNEATLRIYLNALLGN